MHPVADDEGRLLAIALNEKARNIRRGMLSVTVHIERPGKSQFGGAPPARLERSALSGRRGESNHFSASRFSFCRCGVPRAVIHDNDFRKEFADLGHKRTDGCLLIQARNDNRAA